MKKLLLGLLISTAALATELPDLQTGRHLDAVCYAYTYCPNFGTTIRCMVNAPCRWEVQLGRYVDCRGFDNFGRPVVIQHTCWGGELAK